MAQITPPLYIHLSAQAYVANLQSKCNDHESAHKKGAHKRYCNKFTPCWRPQMSTYNHLTLNERIKIMTMTQKNPQPPSQLSWGAANQPSRASYVATKTCMTPFGHKRITSKSARLVGASASSMTLNSMHWLKKNSLSSNGRRSRSSADCAMKTANIPSAAQPSIAPSTWGSLTTRIG